MTKPSDSVDFGTQTDEATSLLRVINLVRTGEATTRPEIGRVTGLGRGVVTQRVDHAIRMGFLADAAFAASSGGRAPRTLRFRAEQAHFLICALEATHVRVGVTALDGDIIGHSYRRWDIAEGPGETLDTVMAMADELLSGLAKLPIWGVVIGLPGPVDFSTGQPVMPPVMPGWNCVDVRTPFEQRYNAPVWVDKDVNLLALGERARRRTAAADLIYCNFGHGIGAALLSQDRIHRGANGSAGDIGHLPQPDSHEVCRCGKSGCLEAVAGGWAIVRDAVRMIDQGATTSLRAQIEDRSLSVEDITNAAKSGDPLAIGLIKKAAQLSGKAIATLVDMFNPAVVVVGGAITLAGDLFLAEVRRRVYELSVPLASRDLMIVLSANDESEPLRGGFELAQEQLFDITFKHWFAHRSPNLELTRS